MAYALRADPGRTGQGHNTNYVTGDRPVWQQQGSKVGPAGSLRTGGNHTNGVPFTTYEISSEDSPQQEMPVIAFGHANGIDPQAHESLAPTMRAGHNVGGGSDASAAAVRQLTPVECERLQGYEDGWTATINGRPQSDSARYRQLGNSIAVPVFEWVARRIAEVDRRVTTTEREN